MGLTSTGVRPFLESHSVSGSGHQVAGVCFDDDPKFLSGLELQAIPSSKGQVDDYFYCVTSFSSAISFRSAIDLRFAIDLRSAIDLGDYGHISLNEGFQFAWNYVTGTQSGWLDGCEKNVAGTNSDF